MIRLLWKYPRSIEDIRALVQTAIDLEFATLPPYLYAKFSIIPDKNKAAHDLISSVAGEEMIHMCLACNIMNAIGGTVAINPPSYPGPLPGGVDGGLTVHLYPFSPEAMKQGMDIETPVEPLEPTAFVATPDLTQEGPVTIGVFYERLDAVLKALPADDWTPHRNQITDDQYMIGQIFAVNNYDDAHRAISEIVSEGEGSPQSATQGSPLDFEGELAHYYRFEEIYRNQVLTKDITEPSGYRWGEPLGVNWDGIHDAISDPESFDFSNQSDAVKKAQLDCNLAYSAMVDELRRAFGGEKDRLGNAIRAMFDLRMAAMKALVTPLNNGKVAGPSFTYITQTDKGAQS